jgi:hypothetical protein
MTTTSKRSSKPKATSLPLHQSPPTHCLSGLLAAVKSGSMTKEQAHEIASGWRKEYQEWLTQKR